MKDPTLTALADQPRAASRPSNNPKTPPQITVLALNGRVGIVLPETYFFSYSYRWLPHWLKDRLALRGMLNIPMEAFEEFCRAKTNFYIFEKVGHVESAFDSSAIPKKATAKKEAGK